MKTMKAKKMFHAASILALIPACSNGIGPSREEIASHAPFSAGGQEAASRPTKKTPSHSGRIGDAAVRLTDDSPEWLVQMFGPVKAG